MSTYAIQYFNAENNSIEVDFVYHITKDLQCGLQQDGHKQLKQDDAKTQ
ncbi:hypothetical protein [Vibrio aestuarianus]|uniref:Uncharacterized protein n=1 Tax=Vibrio aestuarianus TaxID=28171 RepID=A0ABM9FK27_9VIBR|nr:hypothetical protein [Vibrio aestuarianus]MDE1214269.1 hypothetical protein [Vibrio aestuarianus]MDE1219340.1 hypothetical protein [Vibrio aestuarianus]MDE1229384.1 hypothetical protein [Vibrio aestuarianus]MDE1258764.1 hypothetical protein [Vibrio aestuarianus]MDE1261253.1 hypothetical protein [Vibrio aestuarianus]